MHLQEKSTLLNHLATPGHSIQNYWPNKNKKAAYKHTFYYTLLNLHWPRSSYQLRQTPALPSLPKHICPQSSDTSTAALSWRNSRALAPQKPRSTMSSLSRGCGSSPPGPAHPLPTIPWERGGPNHHKAWRRPRGAAGSFLLCLELTACKALNRASDPHWKRRHLLFYCNYICGISTVTG